jgi:hypothetical protein
MLNRRKFISLTGAVGVGGLCPSVGLAEEKSAAQLMTPRTTAAVNKGLASLARLQLEQGKDRGGFGKSGIDGSVAVAGLSGLAFMCSGSTPDIGPYGKQVKRCVDFLMNNTQPSGYIGRTVGNQGNMYGHGFSSLFLGLAYGMAPQKRLGKSIRSSVKLIIDAQNDRGGWRYQPTKSDADLSITVCQIMALRAAREAGIHVPSDVREKCIGYVKKSQSADGGFNYTQGSGYATFPCTAAGLVSLYSSGIYEGEVIEKGLKYLTRNKLRSGASYYYYGNYYGVQAMWHAGGAYWEKWYPAIRNELLNNQGADGLWSGQRGKAYSTAMALIILQMPKDIVPVVAK